MKACRHTQTQTQCACVQKHKNDDSGFSGEGVFQLTSDFYSTMLLFSLGILIFIIIIFYI